MKKTFSILTTLILSAAALSLSSCLKDPRVQDFSNVGTLIELPLEAFNGPGKLVAEALPIQDAPQIIPIVVNVASPSPLSSPLTVTLAIDQTALDAYNTANGLTVDDGTAFSLPPADAFNIPNLKVTIPAGKRTASLNVNIISSKLDPAGLYIIPISIADASGQKISLYKTVLLNVQAKNKYDGVYTATGSFTDTGVPANTDADIYPYDIWLVTQGANSVAFEDPDNGFVHLINAAGTINAYGTFAPVFVFDPATNKITGTSNYYGVPPNGRQVKLDVSGVNALTGTPGQAGSVIKVKYIMTQPGFGDRVFFNETYTYKGERP